MRMLGVEQKLPSMYGSLQLFLLGDPLIGQPLIPRELEILSFLYQALYSIG